MRASKNELYGTYQTAGTGPSIQVNESWGSGVEGMSKVLEIHHQVLSPYTSTKQVGILADQLALTSMAPDNIRGYWCIQR